jgi:hypothetical protein
VTLTYNGQPILDIPSITITSVPVMDVNGQYLHHEIKIEAKLTAKDDEYEGGK